MNILLKATIFASALFQCVFLSSAVAQELEPSQQVQVVQPEPVPEQLVVQVPPERLQAEAAIGRNLTREYDRYLALFSVNPENRPVFSKYLYDEYSKRRESGIKLLAIGTTLTALSTLVGILSFYQHAKSDGDGYCSFGGGGIDSTDDCDEDDGEMIGIILVASFGGMATLAVTIPGIVKTAKYNKRVRRLKPIVERKQVSFFYGIGKKSFVTGLRF